MKAMLKYDSECEVCINITVEIVILLNNFPMFELENLKPTGKFYWSSLVEHTFFSTTPSH